MTIADVAEFYVRRDLYDSTGKEGQCYGCDAKFKAGDPYSPYDLAGKELTPRSFPPTINLCKKCTYQVIGYRPSAPAPPPLG